MSRSTKAPQVVPAAMITRSVAVILGDVQSDITVYHARTSCARIGLIFGSTLMTLYSASAAQGLLEAFTAPCPPMAQIPRQLPPPAPPPCEPFVRTTLAIEWTNRPTYCAVPQSGPNKT